jgi:hypothetical protein
LFQRSRNAGFSCYSVTPFPENCCSTLFTTGCKRLTEGGQEAFASEAFCFLMGMAFELLVFWCGRLLEGKRIAEGERTAKGELLASLRAET